MLSGAQIDHFRAFGFVALPGLLGAQRAEALRAEVDAAIRDAYASTYDERVIDGISGHYLPMASRLTPLSALLVCDDPVLIDAAEQLVGGPVLPSVPEGVLYFGEAGWHNDDGVGVRGVKFAAYFDSLCATNGALRFVPCSHQADAMAALYAYRRAGHEAYPSVVVDSEQGDVIAFDLHTFHASHGGRDRLAWAIEYLAAPEANEERDKTLRWMTDAFEQEFHGFDRDRYPVWRDWLINPGGIGRRAAVIERLCSAGVLDLPGAEGGS
ncbi:MAG: phytanoyl-CoA dioxygenase family protein [Streptosporangiaceae bacterium]